MGDKWETSIKSCGQSTESIQSLLGDKWETSGRQVGDYTTVDPKQFALFKPKLELATPRAGRQRIAYRAGGHILRKN